MKGDGLFRGWSPFRKSPLLSLCEVLLTCTLTSDPHHDLYDPCCRWATWGGAMSHHLRSSSAQAAWPWRLPGSWCPQQLQVSDPDAHPGSGSSGGHGVQAGKAQCTHSGPQFPSEEHCCCFVPVQPWAGFQNAPDFIVQPDDLFLCCFRVSTFITATVKAHFSSVLPADPPFITAAPMALMATHVSPAFMSSWSPGQMPCQEPLALSATVQFLKKDKNGSVFPLSIIICSEIKLFQVVLSARVVGPELLQMSCPGAAAFIWGTSLRASFAFRFFTRFVLRPAGALVEPGKCTNSLSVYHFIYHCF